MTTLIEELKNIVPQMALTVLATLFLIGIVLMIRQRSDRQD
jgi:hypothetical protein